MFTATLPHEHGFHSATPDFRSLDIEDTFLAHLSDYNSVGVSANPYASPIFGFDSIFDEFYHITGSRPFSDGLSASEFWHTSDAEHLDRYVDYLISCLEHENPLRSIGNGIASQIQKFFYTSSIRSPFDDGCRRILRKVEDVLNKDDEPSFVFVNIMDAHGPLSNSLWYDQSLISADNPGKNPPIDPLELTLDDEFEYHSTAIEHYQELYAAAVKYTIERVADFCSNIDDDTAVIVTADHGEQLAETESDRRFGHVTPDLTEQLLHVPLEIVNAEVATNEQKLISHLDLESLILSIAREDRFNQSSPIASEVAGMGVANPPADHPNIEFWSRTVRCYYADDRKFVWDSEGNTDVFHRLDGWSVRSDEVAHDSPPKFAYEPFNTDISEVNQTRETDELDPGIRSQLEELGYL